MKIALYIEDGVEQIVLTPGTETEKAILGKLASGDRQMTIYRGSFYECRGGWNRQSVNDDSTIIRLTPRAPETSE